MPGPGTSGRGPEPEPFAVRPGTRFRPPLACSLPRLPPGEAYNGPSMREEPGPVPTEDILFGELVVAQGVCPRAKVDECLALLERMRIGGVTPLPRLGELLSKMGYLSRDEVQAILRAANPGSQPPRTPRSTSESEPPPVRSAAANPANRVGKYVRTRLLGAGGMGEVWQVWDRELRRWVALKFLKGDDPEEISRFRREAQTAARLNHHNIASIYEVGETGGKPFIAMQFVGGQTLGTFPRDNVRTVVILMRDAARAVHYAHEQGVVHRDLKPPNFMVEEAGGKLRLYVMDFGLAKQMSTDSSLSVSGVILGTPAYMPPEQARGESNRATPACDVYSLGATLYELLADRPPFQAKDLYALLERVVRADPTPVRERNPKIDRELNTITMKCMEKEPARRYRTARELADDLTRWLSGEPILAHPPTTIYKVKKFIARRKVIAGLTLALVLVAALVPFLLSNWLGAKAETVVLKDLGSLRTQMVVIREWTRQGFQAPEKIREAIEGELARQTQFIEGHGDLPQGFYVRAQAKLYLYDLGGAEADLERALKVAPDFSPAWALLGQSKLERYFPLTYPGETIQFQEKVERERFAEPILQEAVAAFRQSAATREARGGIEGWGLSRTRDDEIAEILSVALEQCYLRADREGARRRLLGAQKDRPSEEFCREIALWSDSPEEKSRWIELSLRIAPHYAAAYVDRALLRFERRENEGALEDCVQAIRINPRHVVAHCYKGRAHNRLGDVEAAIREENEAILLDPRSSTAYYYRGFFRKAKGEYPGAISDFARAIEIFPNFSFAYVNRAEAYRQSGNPDGAISDVAKVREVLPKWGYPCHLAGLAFEDKGDLTGAMREQSQAIDLDPRLWDAYLARARLYYQAGDYLGCHADGQKMVELNPKLPAGYTFMGTSKAARNDWPGALQDWESALKADPRYVTVFIDRGIFRMARRELDLALADLTRAIEIDPAQPFPYFHRAHVERARGKLELAIRDLERALEVAPARWPPRKQAELELESARKSRKPEK
jgi:tetratricopeptide (TPR) repeat protein